MKLSTPPLKPLISTSSPLCTFRSSKAYLWGLIRDRLVHFSHALDDPKILDAACHSLITRQMFPIDCHYFGLDISRSRLLAAQRVALPGDRLLLADLTRPLSISACFDIVVSCNTLSHLSADLQTLALINLIDLCVKGGTFFLNVDLSLSHMFLASKLISNFNTVEIIYFDSYLSNTAESNGLINSNNISSYIEINEINLPNCAALHKQVLFLCKDKSSSQSSIFPDPHSESPICLNSIPNVFKHFFDNDNDLFSFILSQEKTHSIVFSSKFYHSPLGVQLSAKLLSVNFESFILDDSITPSPKNYIVLGLESQWTSDEASDRILLNNLRRSSLSICLCFVSFRDGIPCSPSLIAGDY